MGGGIIGLSIAWRAAQLGLSVTVLDKDARPAGASWVAAGMLAPVTEADFGEDALLGLNLEGARRWPDFTAELSESAGTDLNATEPGSLYVAVDRDQLEALRRLYDYQLSVGLTVSWLDSRSCRKLEPGLHPSTRGGILADGDAAVDPRKVIDALVTALKHASVPVSYGSRVASIRRGDPPAAVLEDGEAVAGRCIVLAAGCWSTLIPGVADEIKDAVRPVKGQILRLRTSFSHPALRRVVRNEEVYLVPRPNGELIVGATVEEKGFDTTLTAGAVFELLRAAGEVFPGVRELELVEASVGLRPGSRDNLPLIGPSGVPGVVVACGHYRNGILQAPVTADAIAHLLAKGELPEGNDPYDPRRFAS
ncbi:MAG: glycine oxidase ThiO [Actinomycetota bacterium]|nr:glycine oxidase ThiO [Actinomycetota bacterium]